MLEYRMSRALLVVLVVVVGVWVAATLLPSQGARIVAFAVLGLCGVALMVIARLLRRRAGTLEPPDPRRAAQFAVTQMLGTLTRMQVAYLSQGFGSQAEGRAWLKQALPRSFRGAMDELLVELERARLGERPESLSLPLRVLELRRMLERQSTALELLSPRYPGYALARPLVFVVTENVSEEGDADPIVLSLAGWDPSQPTLLPVVEVLTVYSGTGASRKVLGQIDFKRAEVALRPHLQAEEGSGEARVLVCGGTSLAELAFPLAEIPLGFLVADAEDGGV